MPPIRKSKTINDTLPKNAVDQFGDDHGGANVKARGFLVEKCGEQRLNDAFQRCINLPNDVDTRMVVEGAPGQPDYMADLRRTAVLLGILQHDTLERRALLKSAGVAEDDLTGRNCLNISRILMSELDEYQKDTEGLRSRSDLRYDHDPVPPLHEGLNTRRLSEVQPRSVSWLWDQRIPLGKESIISGDANLGKTWVVLDIIARITTGRSFPDGAPNPFGGARRDALWVSAEDEDEDTILPRLLKLGADTYRVHSLPFGSVVVKEQDPVTKGWEDAKKTLNLSQHLGFLDTYLNQHPLVALVALDPLTAFLGKTDTHRNSEVRALLTPLAELASKHKVAIIGINHLNKGDGDNAMYRGMGSVAFVAASRASWMVTKDPKEPKVRRLFTEVKGNLREEDVGGLAFRIGKAYDTVISWEEGKVDMTGDEALRALQPTDKSRAPALAEAKQWLQELLKDGPVLAADVWAKAEADGLNKTTLNKAKKELEVKTRKTGGTGDPWVWSLPEDAKP